MICRSPTMWKAADHFFSMKKAEEALKLLEFSMSDLAYHNQGVSSAFASIVVTASCCSEMLS